MVGAPQGPGTLQTVSAVVRVVTAPPRAETVPRTGLKVDDLAGQYPSRKRMIAGAETMTTAVAEPRSSCALGAADMTNPLRNERGATVEAEFTISVAAASIPTRVTRAIGLYPTRIWRERHEHLRERADLADTHWAVGVPEQPFRQHR